MTHDAPSCWLIGNEFVNGNPVTIALDRVAPPEPTDTDWVTRHMREISRARFGHDDILRWTPDFNTWKMAQPETASIIEPDFGRFEPVIADEDPDADVPVP